MKSYRLTLALVACLLFSLASPVLADDPPMEVRAVAEEAMPGWLDLVGRSPAAHSGITDAQDLEKAALGQPYEVYTVSHERLQRYDGRSPIQPLLSKADRWLFPVLIDGKARLVLDVVFFDGRWRPARVGGAALAEDLDEMAQRLPAFLQARGMEGEHSVRLVSIDDVYEFLLVSGPSGEFALLPRWAVLFDLPQGEPADPTLLIAQLARRAQDLAAQDQDGGADGGSAGITWKEPLVSAEWQLGMAWNRYWLVAVPGVLAVATLSALIMVRRRRAANS